MTNLKDPYFPVPILANPLPEAFVTNKYLPLHAMLGHFSSTVRLTGKSGKGLHGHSSVKSEVFNKEGLA